METLRLVDVTDDGQLVLMSGDGRRFHLPVDAEVRSAIRRDRATAVARGGDRPGPREVQARIRAGADAAAVAEATGLDLTYVRRFEGPALAERSHIADLARLSPVHRDPGARQITLEAAVLAALGEGGYDTESLSWDSRRVEGSRWDVVLNVPATGHGEAPALEATWRFDVSTRSLEELDDQARALTRFEQRRLAPVRDRVFDIDAGRATVRARRSAQNAEATSTAALLEALAQQRGRRPQPGSASGAASIPAADEVDEAADSPVTRLPVAGARPATSSHPAGRGRGAVPAIEPDPFPDTPDVGSGELSIDPDLIGSLDLDAVEPAPPARRPASGARRTPVPRSPRTVGRAPAAQGEPVARREAGQPASARTDARTAGTAPGVTGTVAPTQPPQDDAKEARPSRRRRAGVPSWDDIVFGARHDGED